tara:strand:+ start:621 stop:1265 length:645 start_codon:yes stop_codon:yes gene_type:complete
MTNFQKRFLSSLLLIPIALFFIMKGTYFFNFFILICLLISFYEWFYMSRNKQYNILGFIFIIFSFYTFYFFRNEGYFEIFLLTLIVCISTDIGGYIFGKIFKGPKLTKISPNKTYAGVFGSFFLSIISASIYFNNLSLITKSNLDEGEIGLQTMIIVLFISLASQAGDLTISFFKRKSKIKNTGKIIPGHGGLLDRIDGMIFAFPAIYLIFKIL